MNSNFSKKTIDLTASSPGIMEKETKRLLQWSKESIMSAKNCLDEMMENTKSLKEHGIEQIENTNFRNIIAFTGDRGTGKTTAMRLFLSFLDGFRNISTEGIDDDVIRSFKNINFEKRVETIPIIDTCRKTLRIFVMDKKPCAKIDSTSNNKTKKINVA